jgi:hypothetical protein
MRPWRTIQFNRAPAKLLKRLPGSRWCPNLAGRRPITHNAPAPPDSQINSRALSVSVYTALCWLSVGLVTNGNVRYGPTTSGECPPVLQSELNADLETGNIPKVKLEARTIILYRLPV